MFVLTCCLRRILAWNWFLHYCHPTNPETLKALLTHILQQGPSTVHHQWEKISTQYVQTGKSTQIRQFSACGSELSTVLTSQNDLPCRGWPMFSPSREEEVYLCVTLGPTHLFSLWGISLVHLELLLENICGFKQILKKLISSCIKKYQICTY